MAQLWVERLPLFIVRSFTYTGVGQKEQFLVPKIIAHFSKKKPTIELGSLDVFREFGDLRAVVDIYRRLLKHCPIGDTLNVCTGQSYSLCEKITGHSIEVQVNPEIVRTNEVRVLSGSSNRLNQQIGEWNSFRLMETLTWMLSNVRLVAV